MNLDHLWRLPFQSPQTNKAVTQTANEIAKSIVRTSVDYKVLQDDALEVFQGDAGLFDYSDISTLTQVFRYDFRRLILNTNHKQAPRLTNLLRFCETEAKNLGVDRETRGRLYQRSQRLREINQTVEELIIYRNYSAHHTQERNDLGLCFKVPSALLRFVELLDLPSSWANEISIIRNSAIQILTELYVTDPTSEFQKRPAVESKTEPQVSISQVMVKLEEMQGNLRQLITIPNTKLVSPQATHESFAVDQQVEPVDDIPMEYESIPEIVTLARLRQNLLEIRKEIFIEFEFSEDSNNILSHSTIDEIILLGVKKLSEWKKLPSTAKIQINEKQMCVAQLHQFWEKIESHLVKFDWKIGC